MLEDSIMPRKPLVDKPTLSAAGKPLGRPRKAPPSDAAQRIQAAAADGFTIPGVAMTLGVNTEVLKRWFDEFPEFKQAFEFGRETERRTLHNVLYRAATEGTGKDALIAAMFLLKARHGYKEGEPVGEQNSRVQIDIKLPGALPPTVYAQVIEHE